MNIAIIGMGNIGSGLAQVLAKTEHKVVVVDRDNGTAAAEKLRAEGIEVQGAAIADAVKIADVIILSTPYDVVAEVAKLGALRFRQ